MWTAFACSASRSPTPSTAARLTRRNSCRTNQGRNSWPWCFRFEPACPRFVATPEVRLSSRVAPGVGGDWRSVPALVLDWIGSARLRWAWRCLAWLLCRGSLSPPRSLVSARIERALGGAGGFVGGLGPLKAALARCIFIAVESAVGASRHLVLVDLQASGEAASSARGGPRGQFRNLEPPRCPTLEPEPVVLWP